MCSIVVTSHIRDKNRDIHIIVKCYILFLSYSVSPLKALLSVQQKIQAHNGKNAKFLPSLN